MRVNEIMLLIQLLYLNTERTTKVCRIMRLLNNTRYKRTTTCRTGKLAPALGVQLDKVMPVRGDCHAIHMHSVSIQVIPDEWLANTHGADDASSLD
jgi:hypothetical protein